MLNIYSNPTESMQRGAATTTGGLLTQKKPVPTVPQTVPHGWNRLPGNLNIP